MNVYELKKYKKVVVCLGKSALQDVVIIYHPEKVVYSFLAECNAKSKILTLVETSYEGDILSVDTAGIEYFNRKRKV